MLILGLACSAFMSTLLYISAESTFKLRLLQEMPTAQSLGCSASETTGIELPYAVPGTTLIAEKISAYDGPFYEDGTDREVVNIFALHVKNVGMKEVGNAAIFLSTADTGLAFYGEHIPPGATVVLLEITSASFQKMRFSACAGSQMINPVDSVLNRIAITDKSLGTLIVTNISDWPLCNLQLYYKAWLSPPDVYVGGISHCVELPMLMPGQTAYLYPNHYASGYSKVVSATADK